MYCDLFYFSFAGTEKIQSVYDIIFHYISKSFHDTEIEHLYTIAKNKQTKQTKQITKNNYEWSEIFKEPAEIVAGL